MAGRLVNVWGVADPDIDVPAALPGNRRQTDRLALALFHVLRDRSDIDRRHVLESLKFGSSGPDAAMRVWSIEALRLAEAETGSFPSFRRYEAWRLSQTVPREWPSGSSIGRAWGSWSAMLDDLGVQPTVRPATIAMRSLGETFIRDELLEAIRACGREVRKRPLTLKAYRRWAEMTSEWAHHARIPLSSGPFLREFGGFAHAAREAGLPAYHGGSGIKRGQYTDEQVQAALRRCSDELSDRAPTSTAYRRWRRPLVAELRQHGKGTPLPSDTAVLGHFQTWSHALHAAGLISEDEAALVRRRGCRQPLHERRVAGTLLDAVRELGPTVTMTQYGRWRDSQPRPFGLPDAPHEGSLVLRYAPWPALIATVLSVIDDEDPTRELERLLQRIRR